MRLLRLVESCNGPILHERRFPRQTERAEFAETGEQILTLEPGDDRASVMVFSPDGDRLFTGFGRGSGIVWDVRRG